MIRNLRLVWFIQIIILLIINLVVMITGLVYLGIDTQVGVNLEIASLCLTLVLTIEVLAYFRESFEEEKRND